MQESSQETPRIDLVCIFVLAIEWIIFGSCHFVFRVKTEAEIPDNILYIALLPYKTLIAGVTGMVEVATGILILLPKTRKIAAGVSLLLLCLFLPSIYKMLIDDAALPTQGHLGNLWRVLLVPNHVFLVLCAIHLWQRAPRIAPAPAAEGILGGLFGTHQGLSSEPPVPPLKPTSETSTLIVALVMLLANTAGFLVIWTSPWNANKIVNLWAMMCIATGALVGFLFGVPKVYLGQSSSATYRPNTNIEDISDWLTKIIVGVGLVQFREIGEFLKGLSVELGQALVSQSRAQTQAEAASFVQALIIYFFVAGIIQGYLLTRMYLSKRFQESQT